jgi:hypothetical protein
MVGKNQQKKAFCDVLKQVMYSRFPQWEKGEPDLGVSPKTLHRWIHGSHHPNASSMKAFLIAASRLQADFPGDEIDHAYCEMSSSRRSEAMENFDLIGSDAYHSQFNDWCADADEGSLIWIVQNWILYPMKFPDQFVAALERGAVARLLLLQPQSPLVKSRYETTGNSPFSFLAYLSEMPKRIHEAGLHKMPNFEMRFFNAMPPFASYIVDDHILFAPFWASHLTSEAPHLVLSRYSRFGTTVIEDVEYLWNCSDAIGIGEALEVFYKACEGAKNYWGELIRV